MEKERLLKTIQITALGLCTSALIMGCGGESTDEEAAAPAAPSVPGLSGSISFDGPPP